MTFEEDLINQVRLHPVVWNKQSEDYKNRLKSEKAWDIIARNVNKTKKDVKTRWRHLRDVFLKELKKVRKPRSGDPGSPNEQEYSGKWPYYQHMLFLKDVSMPRITECNSVHQETGNNDNDATLPPTSRSEQNLQLPDEENSNRSDFVTSDDEPLSTSASSITRRTSALSTETLDSVSQTGSQKRKRKENQSNLTEYQRRMIQIEEDKIKAFKEKEKEDEDEDILFLKSLAPYFKYLNAVQKLRLKSKLQNTIADETSLAMPSPPSNSSMSIIPPPVHALAMPSPTSNSSMPIIPPPVHALAIPSPPSNSSMSIIPPPVHALAMPSPTSNSSMPIIPPPVHALAIPSPPSNSSMSIIPPPVHALAMPSPTSNSSMPIIPPPVHALAIPSPPSNSSMPIIPSPVRALAMPSPPSNSSQTQTRQFYETSIDEENYTNY